MSEICNIRNNMRTMDLPGRRRNAPSCTAVMETEAGLVFFLVHPLK